MSPPRPDLSVEDGLDADWDEPRITSLVQSIVERERPNLHDWAIGIHLVGDRTIRELNSQHRAMDRATDVLSFPLHDGTDFALPPDEMVHLGDVVVSYPRAVEQASEFGHSVEREVAYLVAHGVLHVLGYDHEQEDQQRAMRAKEEEALEPLGLTR